MRRLASGARGQAKGYVQTMPPVTQIDASAGLAVSLRNGDPLTLAAAWTAADCLSIRGTTGCTSSPGPGTMDVSTVTRDRLPAERPFD